MLKPGLVIAQKYQIEHLIAEGGMAELYLARCLSEVSPHEFVAIKRLIPALRNIDSHVESFYREARYIITLRSHHIVKGLELVDEASELLLIMEYILGPQISHVGLILKKQSLNLRIKVALGVALGIAKALKVIRDWPLEDGHKLDLVHGDISGQNIILSIDGQIKLVDFGVAITASKQQGSENDLLRGTMRYMSPEQRQGKPLTQASDIYSLALVLEEVIQEEFNMHELSAIIKRAKACDLKIRYASADELLADLEKFSLNFGAWDPQAFLCKVLENQPQSIRRRPSIFMTRLVSLTTALVLIGALVVATGTRYFYPRIPDLGLDDHHCENYSEDLLVGASNL